MSEKKIAEVIKNELVKMLSSGLIDKEQYEAITKMVNAVTKKAEKQIKYSEDGKIAYFNGHKYREMKKGYYIRNEILHVAVWEYYNGISKPEGYDIHHNGKDEYGKWDNKKNEIEHLMLLSKKEHNKLHSNSNVYKEVKCTICGETFKVKTRGNSNAKYCPNCHKEAYRQMNNAQNKRWRKEHPDKVKEYSKRQREKEKKKKTEAMKTLF